MKEVIRDFWNKRRAKRRVVSSFFRKNTIKN